MNEEERKILSQPHEGFVIKHNSILDDGQVVKMGRDLYMNSNSFYQFSINTWGLTEGVDVSIRFATQIVNEFISNK